MRVIKTEVLVIGSGFGAAAPALRMAEAGFQVLSPHVGKNIAFNGSVKAAGLLPEGFIEGDMLSGRSHPGMVSYQFLKSMGVTISCAKPLPLHIVHAARLVLDGETRRPSFWGQAHVDLMKLYRRRMITIYALGMTPPCAEITSTGADVSPSLVVDDQLRVYHKRTKALLNSIFTRNGCRIIHAGMIDHEGTPRKDISFDTTHMIGSCRMADSKDRGVVDAYGEVFDYPGIYITDGAAIPSSLAVNSSLTILANAERIASHLVKWYAQRSGDPADQKLRRPAKFATFR